MGKLLADYRLFSSTLTLILLCQREKLGLGFFNTVKCWCIKGLNIHQLELFQEHKKMFYQAMKRQKQKTVEALKLSYKALKIKEWHYDNSRYTRLREAVEKAQGNKKELPY